MRLRRTTNRSLLVFLGAALLACSDDPVRLDRLAPVVESVAPARNAATVSLRASLVVGFSENVIIPDSTTFLRLLHNGADVAGTIARPDRRHIELTPSEPLEPGAQYDIVIKGSIVDGAGNTSAVDSTWSFTTVGRPFGTIDVAGIMLHLSRLAHDSMGGRGSGTTDEARAATYIASQFQAAGVQPPPGSFLSQFVIPPARVGGRIDVTSQNVIGVIAGSGSLQNEWIVLGAHYDHVGTRTVNGVPTIYNGADDNGSGTAVILQIATQLSSYIASGGLGTESRRSIMFIAFGAEELGLIGSEQYCGQPKYPLANIAAMLNFDMVGRMRNRTLMMGGFPTSASWRPLVARYNQDQLTIGETDCSGCTDFACFRRNRRPVLWFFTDMHPEYHRPEDDVALINTQGIGQIASLAARITLNLAVRTNSPTFTQ